MVAVMIVPADNKTPFLLATDIDGTLLGPTGEESWLCAFAKEYPQSIILAYMTGRSLPSVQALIAEGIIPPPHYICSHVGTELFDCRHRDTAINTLFTEGVDRDHWHLEEIYAHGVGEGVRRQVFTNGQPPYHAGFFWDGQKDSLNAFRDRLRWCTACSIVVSHEKFIDVIPDVLGKGNAVSFLKNHLCLSPDDIVVAGDSGNDSSMFDTPFKAIIPANGYEELRKKADKAWHHHSTFEAGEGVLDGLYRFGFVKKSTGKKLKQGTCRG